VLVPFCERERSTSRDQRDRRALDRLASERYDRERPLSPSSGERHGRGAATGHKVPAPRQAIPRVIKIVDDRGYRRLISLFGTPAWIPLVRLAYREAGT
jgi:hypothetical protein